MSVAGVEGLKQGGYPRRCPVARTVGLSKKLRTSEAHVSARRLWEPKEEASGLGAGRLYTDCARDDASCADRGRFPRAGQTTGPQSLVVSPRTTAAQPFESPSNSLQGS